MAKQEAFRSVLIFGGAGFIGSNWASRLLDQTQAKVHVFDNLSRRGSRQNLAYLQKLAGKSGRLQITIGDVRDQIMVQRVIRYATEIYNFAAQVAVTSSIVDPRLDFDVNLGGTFNILEAARLSGNNPFLLFTSTNKVYGKFADGDITTQGKRFVSASNSGINEDQPLDFHSPYGCSKGAADQYVRDYSRIFALPTVVFRMSCIAGPRQFGNEDQGWLAHFLYSTLQRSPVTIYGSGKQVRDVLLVDDLLNALEAVREHRMKTSGQIYNVGGGQANSISLLELLDSIEMLTGMRATHQFAEMRPGDQPVYITDHSKLTRDTGWKPEASLDKVLQRIYAWYKSNRELVSPERTQADTITAAPDWAALPRTA